MKKQWLLAVYANLCSVNQNIANKNIQDAYYSETSTSDTALIILIVQSRDTPTRF